MKSKDEQIKKAVIDTIYWDNRVDASGIKVEVNEGIVTLAGTVPSYGANEAALFTTLKVPGVIQVHNNSSVKFPSSTKILTDAQIEESIKKQLEWNDSTSKENIQVTVKKGTVILEGYVSAYWKILRAQKLASDVIGVVDIDNKLTVVPTESINDQIIATDIINAIDRSYLLDTDDVDVKLKNGIVTLCGELPNRALCESALEFAYHTYGVKEVKDRLHLK